MALSPGTRLGVFEIAQLIGAGGMGEVYRARDTKLGREVAIKVLPEDFAKDSERLARFEREAQMLAALDHPNIAALYDFRTETIGGIHPPRLRWTPFKGGLTRGGYGKSPFKGGLARGDFGKSPFEGGFRGM